VHLTPSHIANPVALPSVESHDKSSLDPDGKNIDPPGFVPLSPITAMANLNPYPPAFDGHSAAKRPDFIYPASPLARTQ